MRSHRPLIPHRSRSPSPLLALPLSLLLPLLFSVFLTTPKPPPPPLSPSLPLLHSSLSKPQISSQLSQHLTERFNIPPSLLLHLPPPLLYSLLLNLQPPPSRKLFILHLTGSSPSSRLAAIASAFSYAHHTGRLLLLLWDVSVGGDQLGAEPLALTKDAKNVLLLHVSSLRLNPSNTHWAEYQINYYTSSGNGGYPLDSVAALASRHIFYRTSDALPARYASLDPGVRLMERMLKPNNNLLTPFWHSFLKDWTFPNMDESQLCETLHRVYGVPRIFLDGLDADAKRRLLRGLMESTSKRAFFVHAQYGLGNRLRALGSAMAVAKVTGRVLVLIWEKDVHLNCEFSDLFANELITMSKLNMEWPPNSGGRRGDPALRTVDFYNFMRSGGKHIHNPLKQLVNPRSGRHVYVKTAYVVRSSFVPRIISTSSPHWKTMRESLVPNVEIMTLVNDPGFVNIRGMVGVHIRSRTIENDIKGVNEESYGNGSRTTDHWRRLTGLKTFEKKIMRLSLRYKFFVAADAREVIESLEKKFGSHRIFSLPRDQDCVTRDVECAKLALADILLLSKTPTLLGSNWSSFTEGAVRLSGHIKVLLAGVHFGRAGS